MAKIFYPNEIGVFFTEITSDIKKVLNPEYILVAGSFGKGSWLYDSDELMSDFELAFVCQKKWSLFKKKKLQQDLNEKYGYDISLKGYLLHNVNNKVISNYSFKNPGYISLDFFDTFNNTVILYNKNNKILDVDCNVNEIPIWEAWRLYVNRIGDLLKLECHEDYDKKTEDYYWLKIFEATADAYCIINKIYDKNIFKKLEIFSAELIEKDEQLNEICKNSFSTIKQALLARDKHELSIFKNNLNIKKRRAIVNSWMRYFEKRLSEAEKNSSTSDYDFINNYLENKILHKKYLGFNYYFNKFVSNSIRLIFYPKLINFKFKFYNNRYSWKHIALLSVSSTFNEINLEHRNFSETKSIINKIARTGNLSGNDFIKKIINYWSILR